MNSPLFYHRLWAALSIALQAAKVPMELHIYPTGGHGYGRCRTSENVTSWFDRAADWMRGRGLLARERK